jgi:3-mercaptopyruvate sulfurtransferase SseA
VNSNLYRNKNRILGASIALLLFFGAGLGSVFASGAKEAKTAAAPARGGIFISQEEFAPLVGQAGYKIIDLRSEAAYKAGHIPGAINLPFNVLQVPERDGLRSKWADDKDLEKAYAAAGLSYDDKLLLYDSTSVSGGKNYVIIHASGFPNIRVLDGGISAWKGKKSTEIPTIVASNFKLTKKNASFIVGSDFVSQKIGDNAAQIVDGRNYQAYEDGHIPTSVQISPNDLIGTDNKLKAYGEILALLAQRGISQDKTIVSYCGSGGAASNNYLVLKELGFKNVVLYEDSWDDWSRDTSKVQEVSVPNFKVDNPVAYSKSLGPRFWSEKNLKEANANRSVVILDVRSGADFNAGRIPGSVNAYWNDTFDANRNLKSPEILLKWLADKGVTPDKQVVIFTRGGIQLSHSYFVLKLLGFEKVGAYNGRWEGWEIPSWAALKVSSGR